MSQANVRKSLIVALDFDGVIVSDRFPQIGTRIGAEKWVPYLQDEFGLRVILWTCRSDKQIDLRGVLAKDIVKMEGQYLSAAIEECKAQRIRLWGIDQNPDQYKWSTSRKAYAHVYIDDKCMGIPLIQLKTEPKPCVDWDKVGYNLFQMCYNAAAGEEG